MNPMLFSAATKSQRACAWRCNWRASSSRAASTLAAAPAALMALMQLTGPPRLPVKSRARILNNLHPPHNIIYIGMAHAARILRMEQRAADVMVGVLGSPIAKIRHVAIGARHARL